jgi:hypothetical protein
MKVGLTRKEIISIANKTGMFFNPNMTKSNMIQFVIAGVNGDNKTAQLFAKSIIEADKQYQRDRKLKSIGI